MKCEDLMIGDLVYHHNEVVRITGIGQNLVTYIYYHYVDCEVTEIEPIPLTAEIFEKNGFQKNKISNYETRFCIECGYNVLYVKDIGIQEFDVGNSSDEEGDLRGFATIKYVHELQHALRLCGIEKEIKI